MTRRRRRGRVTLRHAGLLVPGPAGGAYGWHEIRAHFLATPFYRFGELGLVGAGLLIFPLIVLAVLAVATVPHLLVPRRWRVMYRHAHGRQDAKSARIPAHLRMVVTFADRRRCVFCHSRQGLQIDHILPWAAGGRTWLWNLALLCARCNKIKSNYWHKTPHLYRPFPGYNNPRLAREIELKERTIVRWSPLRWARAVWALG